MGDYYNGGNNSSGKGAGTYDVSYNMGLPLFDKGFVNFTVEKQFSNFTQYGGADNRYINAQGNPVAQQHRHQRRREWRRQPFGRGNGIPNSFLPTVTGYPRSNAIDGSPQQQLTMAEMNAGYDFSDSVSALCLRHHRPQIRQVVRK